jgi:hypothetical protein
VTEQNRPNAKAQGETGRTPGAAGHPEPGSGHDDSETTTVAEGPPRVPVSGEPGASGPSVASRIEGATAAEHVGKTDRSS